MSITTGAVITFRRRMLTITCARLPRIISLRRTFGHGLELIMSCKPLGNWGHSFRRDKASTLWHGRSNAWLESWATPPWYVANATFTPRSWTPTWQIAYFRHCRKASSLVFSRPMKPRCLHFFARPSTSQLEACRPAHGGSMPCLASGVAVASLERLPCAIGDWLLTWSLHRHGGLLALPVIRKR